MPKGEPSVGASGIATRMVQESDLASKQAAEPGEAFPPTLSTARLAALVELAAARAIRPVLEKGETTVGTALELRHLAPTAQGGSVRARARLVEKDGEELVFDVTVEDDGGAIGAARHRRRIVELAAWTDEAKKRQG